MLARAELPGIDAAAVQSTPLRVCPGSEVRHAGGGTYRVLGVASHCRTFQEGVVVEGVSGVDRGRLYVVPLDMFAERFAAVHVPPAEKAAGHISESVHA